MKIKVLGCHGSDVLLSRDGATHSCNTCGFLLDDTILLDAGTVGSKLPLEAQVRIRNVFLSHLHFDHIKGLPTLADNLSEQGGPPVVVAGRLPAWFRAQVDAPTFLLLPLQLKKAPLGLIYLDKPEAGSLVLGPDDMGLLRALRDQLVTAFRLGQNG